MLPVMIGLFIASIILNAWFTWQMFQAHKEHHNRMQDIVVDTFYSLANRIEELEKRHNWTGE